MKHFDNLINYKPAHCATHDDNHQRGSPPGDVYMYMDPKITGPRLKTNYLQCSEWDFFDREQREREIE